MEQVSGANETKGDSPSLLDFAVTMAKHKRLVVGLPLLAGILALIVSFMLPKIYTSTARLLPPQQTDSSATAMLGIIAGTAPSATSLSQAFGLRNPNDMYVGILKGETIADRLIQRFNLKDLYGSDTLVATRKKFADVSRIAAGRDGLIAIEVEDQDPKRAAEIANAYVEELDRLMQGLAVTEAAKRRLFFEKQLAQAQEQLVSAEESLRRAIDAKGITAIDAQTRAVVSTTEQLRAQIAVKGIQLEAMRTFATETNPEAVRLRQEIASMNAELDKLEGGGRGGKAGASPAGLANIRKLRDFKFLEFNVDLLTKQYEIAKIDEAKDAVLIQVVDKATAADYKSKPKRLLITVLTTVVFAVLAVLLALLREVMQSARKDPDLSPKLDNLRQHLRWRQV